MNSASLTDSLNQIAFRSQIQHLRSASTHTGVCSASPRPCGWSPALRSAPYHSARIQTLDKDRNPRFYCLLEIPPANGLPLMVDTSFNARGEPIVLHCTAFTVASWRPMCWVEDVVLEKDVATREVDATSRQEHLSQFQLD